MDIIIRGSKLEITEAMESYAKEKISRLEKYLENSDDTHATILVKIHGHLHIVEVTIPLKNFILRAEESKDDFYAAIDTVTDKLERQIRKNKTKLKKQTKSNELKFNFDYDTTSEEDEAKEHKIVKRKTLEMKPMDEEEAILELELLSHDFFIYKDMHNDIKVIYKRKDGNYGIIEIN